MDPRRLAVLACAASALVAAPGARAQEEPANPPGRTPAGSTTIPGDPAEKRVVARVDPRVELLSVVFRLAGNPEYNQGKIPSYAKAVDDRFGPHREHAVVKRAALLRRLRGVSYDAVAGMAVHLDGDFRLPGGAERAARLDARWHRPEVAPFLEELADFATASDFRGFLREQRKFHAAAAARLQSVLDAGLKTEWFEGFFGSRPAAKFALSIGLLNGGGSFGPSVLLADGSEELHCILGAWKVDAAGAPDFDASVIPTVVHEFCHSWANALVDAHMAKLEAPGKAIFQGVAMAMARQAYADHRTMLRESLVRACVVRYRAAVEGPEAAKAEVEEQAGRSFHWTGGLADLLAEYEKGRAETPTLEAFFPRIVAFFEATVQREEERRASVPKIVSIVPAQGAKDVDPLLTEIVVTFDRPMRNRSFAVVGGGPNFPEMKGEPRYDPERRILTIPVVLKPSWRYELWLNRGRFDSFKSREGVPLEPFQYRFQTGAQ